MSAADLLDRDAVAVPPDLGHLIASVLLLRGMGIASYPVTMQEFLAVQDPTRQFLAIADLVLEAAA